MIAKFIIYFDQPRILACDGKCTKAWGIGNRPEVQLSEDPEDTEYLSDGELGIAPDDPSTYEGGHAKPQNLDGRLNKWCCRECERSVMVRPGRDFVLPDFNQRVRNKE